MAVGLLEIADVPRTIPINGKDVAVNGVSAENIAALMMKFPEFGKLFSGAMPEQDSLMKMAPAALGAFLACGTGYSPDHKDFEKVSTIARALGVGDQLDLVDEVLRLTFPRGVGPFVDKLHQLGALAQVDTASLMSSLDKSKNSPQPGTDGKASGS